MEMIRKTYDDYKYVLQDTGSIGFGAKYSYAELIHDEDVPFKFKVIVERYLSKDLDPDTTLESHLYHMTPEGFPYECFLQLKARVKVNLLQEKKRLLGKPKKEYTTRIIPLKEFASKDLNWKKEQGVFIQELLISKLALMTFNA